MPQFQRAHSSSSIRARCSAAAQLSIVTFTWTRPMQTREIVLPPASPYIIFVIQCVRVTERSSSVQLAGWSPHPHKKTWIQTHITPTEVTTGVRMTCMHTHTYAKTILPSPVSCQECIKHTLRSLHPALSNPLPCSKQPPSGLVRANPAVDSVAPIAAPPPLRVVREMKALGVHYKTTTAAAGDRPPGARSYPCSSLHPHLFPSCRSISQPRSTRLPATHSSLLVEKNMAF